MTAAILLTVFISLTLAILFMILFVHDRKNRGIRSLEQDALMPLEEDEKETK